MAEFQPESFGKYFLVDRIATGGMAEIFKAKAFSHGGFEQLLVIKRILAQLGENEDFVEMFIDEAKVSVALQHPNIIRIYDFGKLLSNYFIAMEWVNGKDLRNVLKKLARSRRALPVEFGTYIAIETCRGLDYAHRKTDLEGNPYGIVHRDVSPSNVLLSYEGEVKIADFGIAKAESNAYNTKDGVLKGKFEYMSPEQASGLEIDGRSDIFSLGIILHEMLTGRRLFKHTSETATLEAVKAAAVPVPSTLNDRISPELDRIVLRALARNRADRYQSPREMLEDLVASLGGRTLDTMRHDTALFMRELFAEEIADEGRRLREGAETVDRIRRQTPVGAPESWDAQTNTTMGQKTPVTNAPPPRASALPWLALGALVLFGFGGLALVAVGGAALFGTQAPPAPVAAAPAPVAPTTGRLDLLVLPASVATLDGKPLGEAPSSTFTLADIAAGPHVLRLEAQGYVPLEESVEIPAGGDARLSRTLERVIAKPKDPPKAEVVEVKRTEAASPGALTVAVQGAAWANVYVNGKKLAKMAPLSGYELAPGTYTVRVENPAAGIDTTQTVSVKSGGTAKITGRAE